MEKIKPCPFCGKELRIYVDGYYGSPVIRHNIRSHVSCIMENRVWFAYKVEDVIEMWNRRADD